MPNPLLNLLGGQSPNSAPQGNNMFVMIQKFLQFKNQFQGNPKDKVMEMLNNGTISKEQFEQASQLAKQLESMIPHK